ncbi:sugar phosphate isomerase [Oceanispirochaeta sp.]|jgi:N-acetylmuramic acid 6-phosphate etherase|uniref:sugar phosphate isomerase n=1 Tax=Oceanispirochaeta sp. TaxID=2035350 RepID=UPI0026170E83|nr:sugar phosphate isomerase [Oceanispirochaeta sp.]MDA3957274.1 sugar phosphate isomerase [Oceanispirochaeta sp.]
MTDYNKYAADDTLIMKAKVKAAAFIKDETQFHLGFLPTEQSHPYTRNLSSVIQRDTKEGLKLIFDVDRDLPPVARRIFLSEPFENLCLAFEEAARFNRRVCFTGCGSTGRLSMMLEEMWRQFWEDRDGVNPGDSVRVSVKNENQNKADLACSIMTGGDRALIRSVENFEDYEAFGARQVQDLHLQAKDLLIAISEGGETSSVLGTLREGQRRQCTVFLAFNNPASILRSKLDRCKRVLDADDVTVLDLYTGSMALSGSTRMQATTMEMLIIGAAMEIGLQKAVSGPEDSIRVDPLEYADGFALLIKDLCSPSCLDGMAQWAEAEESIYRKGGRLTYLATSYLLDIFSDTSERSPTFMVPPFRAGDDRTSPVSWAFAKDPARPSDEAWIHMLRRRPRGLNWTKQDYQDMNAPEYAGKNPPVLDAVEISRYSIGNEKDLSRREKDPFLYLHVFVDQLADLKDSVPSHKTLHIGTPLSGHNADISVPLSLSESPISLWQHLAVKLIFNGVSTGTMAMMGRIRQNWMIQLDPTNKKLIDRGSRIVSQLLGISYEDACVELHVSLLARERFLAKGGQTILSPVEAVLQRRG